MGLKPMPRQEGFSYTPTETFFVSCMRDALCEVREFAGSFKAINAMYCIHSRKLLTGFADWILIFDGSCRVCIAHHLEVGGQCPPYKLE
jgi:hypothetical protein